MKPVFVTFLYKKFTVVVRSDVTFMYGGFLQSVLVGCQVKFIERIYCWHLSVQ